MEQLEVKVSECSTELDESECTTGEQLASKSPWKDFWDEELRHYDQEKCNVNEDNNYLAENKYFMYVNAFMNLKDIYSFYLYGLMYVNWEIQMKKRR